MSEHDEVFEADVQRYLTTLRRIPREVRLSMATREYDMGEPMQCVCGWAIRDELVRAVGSDAEGYTRLVQDVCVERFGGNIEEWAAIFRGVCHTDTALPAIETAFTIAVADAVRPQRSRVSVKEGRARVARARQARA